MCTVTFIPDGPDVCHLTSNRDEHRGRARALPPRRYGNATYPKDPVAGGSWIALTQKGDAGILLNGAFIKHRRRPPYRKSRGLVFLDIIRADNPLGHWGHIDLEDIEPFTLVLYIQKKLLECRWDGQHRHLRELETTRPHIWSSVTLYDEAARIHRERLLAQWYMHEKVSTDSILTLHRSAAIHGEIATASITSLRIGRRNTKLRYDDTQAHPFHSSNPFLIRLRHWEYWPFFIVYLPVFLYWAWLSLKARSLFFFSTANPSIRNAGFLLESKQQIYDLLPDGSFPRTAYCHKGAPIKEIQRRLDEQQLTYPLMAKPDIGQRGMGVQLLKDECALLLYSKRSKVDFLLQQYIDYPNEIGIFYYRIPGEEKGTITGIVGKQLLSVTGDGHSTVETLLRQHERYILQLPALRRTIGPLLQTIPAKGEILEPTPYGNHSRGAKFLDESHRITPALTTAIDNLCQKIPGFYFGRLDIRFHSWPQLEKGEAFSVIEVNGAGSEPTHIYDPSHSIFFAWKEIIKHLNILSRISRTLRTMHHLKPMTFFEGLKMLRDYGRHEKLIRQ
ncbi:MAG TPA: hypothetical protein VI233_09530 [Puia sp.]